MPGMLAAGAVCCQQTYQWCQELIALQSAWHHQYRLTGDNTVLLATEHDSCRLQYEITTTATCIHSLTGKHCQALK